MADGPKDQAAFLNKLVAILLVASFLIHGYLFLFSVSRLIKIFTLF